MDNKQMDNLCRSVLESEAYLKDCLKQIEDDPNWIEEHFSGTVSAKTLDQIIDRSIREKGYRCFLENIIDFAEGNVINDRIFEKLINYPDKSIRGSLEVSLAHKKLSEKQLLILCRSQNNFECFFELAILYYTGSGYDMEMLHTFMADFGRCKYSYMMEELLEELLNNCSPSSDEKQVYVQNLLLEYNSGTEYLTKEMINEAVDFYKRNYDMLCIEREGFIFTRITEPLNIMDAIVIRNPENCAAISPQKAFSKRTLEEHIELINRLQLEKACIFADDLDFLVNCPSLKYLEIYPAKTAPKKFDYSPLYQIPEIKYLSVETEYGEHHRQLQTVIDYSKINGLIEVKIGSRGHQNYHQINTLEILQSSDEQMIDFSGMENCPNLKSVYLVESGIRTLKGIENFRNLQSMTLYYNRRLNDASELTGVSDILRQLAIGNCPKITDFSFLEQMVHLERLELSGNNKIPDLEFLNKMPRLKIFTFSMEVENGNLQPCLNVPYVCSVKNRKSYNLKDKDLPKNLDPNGFRLL